MQNEHKTIAPLALIEHEILAATLLDIANSPEVAGSNARRLVDYARQVYSKDLLPIAHLAHDLESCWMNRDDFAFGFAGNSDHFRGL